MKFRSAILLLISMCVMCMFGLLMTNEIRQRSTSWDLVVDETTVAKKTMDFNGFMVVPGGSDEYVVRVKPVASVSADLIIDFTEMENTINSPLKENARVKVAVRGKELFDELLVTLFEDDEYKNGYKEKLQVQEGQSFNIVITFYLGEEVGNEVKNTTADFYVDITLENQVIGD